MTVAVAKRLMTEHGGGLSPTGRALLRHLAVLARPDGTVRWAMSDVQLQRELGYSRSGVKNARRELVGRGLVEIVEAGTGRHATVYRLAVLAPAAAALPEAVGSDPQGVRSGPPGGQSLTPSLAITPPIRERTGSTTYGLYEVPPAGQLRPAAPPPPLRREGDELSDDAVAGFLEALPAELLPRTGFDRVRLLRAIGPPLAKGWQPRQLARAVVDVAALPASVLSGVGLVESRLRTVQLERDHEVVAAAAPAVPWCGDCDEAGRMREGPSGWFRCPVCHPVEVGRSGTDPPF